MGDLGEGQNFCNLGRRMLLSDRFDGVVQFGLVFATTFVGGETLLVQRGE